MNKNRPNQFTQINLLLDNLKTHITLLENDNKNLIAKIISNNSNAEIKQEKQEKITKQEKQVKYEAHVQSNTKKANKIENGNKPNSNSENKDKHDNSSNLKSINITDGLNFNEDQIGDFIYILQKNIEARGLNTKFSNGIFLQEFYVNVKDKNLPSKLSNKIINLLKL